MSERVEWQVAPGMTLVGDVYGNPSALPVLLLHGGGQTRHAWGNTAQALANRGFRAIALDLRGHGESSWDPAGNYVLGRFAEDLVVVARALGRPPAVVGASLGGLSGLLAQGESTEPLFSALILVDVAHRMERQGVKRVISFMRARLAEGFGSVEEAADAIAEYLPHRPRPADLSGLTKNLRLGEDGRYRWHWDPGFVSDQQRVDPAVMGPRLRRAACALRLPTLLIRGRLSDVLSDEVAREFRDLVPHTEYVDIKDAAHMIAGDRNDVFSDAVIDFLQRLEHTTREAR